MTQKLLDAVAQGVTYRQLDNDGSALGCMMPVYMLYPDIPRYAWPDAQTFPETVLNLLKKHGQTIPESEMQPGDVLAFRMPFNLLHMGVYIGNDQIVHCMTNDTMEICRLSFIIRRLEGVFRWLR